MCFAIRIVTVTALAFAACTSAPNALPWYPRPDPVQLHVTRGLADHEVHLAWNSGGMNLFRVDRYDGSVQWGWVGLGMTTDFEWIETPPMQVITFYNVDSCDADTDGYAFDDAWGCEPGLCCAGNDCHDGDSSINPGADDICNNGIDEDCTGADAWCPALGELPPLRAPSHP